MGRMNNPSKKLKTDHSEGQLLKRKYSKLNDSSSSSDFFSSSDESSDGEKMKKKSRQKLLAETISTIENKIGICPECRKLDDGTLMICCDKCDNWFHYLCIGLTDEPKDDTWFCKRCTEPKKERSNGQ